MLSLPLSLCNAFSDRKRCGCDKLEPARAALGQGWRGPDPSGSGPCLARSPSLLPNRWQHPASITAHSKQCRRKQRPRIIPAPAESMRVVLRIKKGASRLQVAALGGRNAHPFSHWTTIRQTNLSDKVGSQAAVSICWTDPKRSSTMPSPVLPAPPTLRSAHNCRGTQGTGPPAALFPLG